MQFPAAPNGSAIIGALKDANVEFVTAVPDIWTSAGFLWPLSVDPDLRLIRLCKEDEGLSICSALAYCNRRAVLSMQTTGLLDSLNDTQIYSVRIVPKVLDAMSVEYVIVDSQDDVHLIAPSIDAAYARSRPVVILIARPVALA